ncbi:MAG: radical SAM protein, partial [Zetaproteobacteria bacterium]
MELAVGPRGWVLRWGAEEVVLAGVFAEALAAWLEGQRWSAWLERLVRAHPWLVGLERAEPIARARLSAAWRRLGLVFVELTARCQERCVHCYAASGPAREEMLPTPIVEAVLEAAARRGRPWVQFTGGDPLLHPDWLRLVRRARALGMPVEVYTNALALREAHLDALAGLGVRLAVSLYAADPEVHDRITQVPGSFRRTWAAVEAAR